MVEDTVKDAGGVPPMRILEMKVKPNQAQGDTEVVPTVQGVSSHFVANKHLPAEERMEIP